mgnify:CR=1 FL=1
MMSKQLKSQLQAEFWQDVIARCIHKHGYADVFLVKARGGGFKMSLYKPKEEWRQSQELLLPRQHSHNSWEVSEQA